MKTIIAWLLAASASWLPFPAPTQTCPFSKGLELHGMTADEYRAKREEMLSDIAEVAFDDAEKPLFDGADGRARTALYLASIARFESAYDLLVDRGEVFGPAGEACIMQVLVDAKYVKNVGMVTAEGWSRKDIIADRKKCVRAALHKLHVSKEICSNGAHAQNNTHKSLTGAAAFSMYTCGKCVEYSPASAHRFNPVAKWVASNPAPSASTATP